MKRFLFSSILIFNIATFALRAGTGDTTVIHVFSFGSSQDSVIIFPPDSLRFEKIIMLYTLKCNPAQNPACGEWDYLTYNYLYVPQGIYDSTVSDLDTISLNPLVIDTTWNVFEVNERFELGRFITPYGIGLNLDNQGIDGGNGFTWVFDVSDYETILTGSKRLVAGNWQEFLDLRFLFIEGTPPRDVVKIENLWNGNFGLSTIDQTVLPKLIQLAPNATMYRMKTRTSGHGQGSASNCGEFCKKQLSVKTDGVLHYSWQLWNKCGSNAVFPQGGTWIFERAGWCPGAIVPDFDHELTPFVTPGTQVLLGYESETDPAGNHVLEVQLISYSAPNFAYDAAIEDIISPSIADLHSRKNPICDSPVIRIKNTGSVNMTSALITYGVEGGSPCYYLWQGNLKFLETAEVALPDFNWSDYNSANPIFYATIDYPSNHYDQYEFNNTARSRFVIPPVLASTFVVWTKPDNYFQELSWTIKDASGNMVASNSPLTASTIYRDTINLQDGCYVFHIVDSGEDGMGFWYYNALDDQYTGTPGYTPYNVGTGYVRLRKITGSSFWKIFEDDFGGEIIYHFTVGDTLGRDSSSYQCNEIVITPTTGVEEVNLIKPSLEIYPNPNHGKFTLELKNADLKNAELKVINVLGQTVFQETMYKTNSGKTTLDLSVEPMGIYILLVKTRIGIISKQFVISNSR